MKFVVGNRTGKLSCGSLFHFISPKNDRFSSNKHQTRLHTPKENLGSLHFTSQKIVCADAGFHAVATLLFFSSSWSSFASQKRQHCNTSVKHAEWAKAGFGRPGRSTARPGSESPAPAKNGQYVFCASFIQLVENRFQAARKVRWQSFPFKEGVVVNLPGSPICCRAWLYEARIAQDAILSFDFLRRKRIFVLPYYNCLVFSDESVVPSVVETRFLLLATCTQN